MRWMVLIACAVVSQGAGGMRKPDRTLAMADNPFAHPSSLPYELPPFDHIGDQDYLPAFEAGMSEHLAQVTRIANDPAAADFRNTVLALESSGLLLRRVSDAFFNLNASNTNPQMQKIDSAIAPRLQAHEDAIFLNPALFARIDAVYRRRSTLKLRS